MKTPSKFLNLLERQILRPTASETIVLHELNVMFTFQNDLNFVFLLYFIVKGSSFVELI